MTPLLDVSIVASTAEPFRCFGSILVEPHAALADVDEVEAVIVCDMYTPIDTPPHGRFAVEIDWLRRMHARGALLASVCSGSLLLAESGLLDGRSCAGHWAYRDLFHSAYPRIRFGPGEVLDRSSEEDGLITAGGVTSWQDLALCLIARFCGAEHASRTAKVYLLAGHEDGQLPFSAMTRRVRTCDAVIRDCLAWIADNYATPNPVSAMTDRSRLTRRTFARRFQAATGRRPIDYVHAVRIDKPGAASRRRPAPSTTSATRWGTRIRPSSAGCSGGPRASRRPPIAGSSPRSSQSGRQDPCAVARPTVSESRT